MTMINTRMCVFILNCTSRTYRHKWKQGRGIKKTLLSLNFTTQFFQLTRSSPILNETRKEQRVFILHDARSTCFSWLIKITNNSYQFVMWVSKYLVNSISCVNAIINWYNFCHYQAVALQLEKSCASLKETSNMSELGNPIELHFKLHCLKPDNSFVYQSRVLHYKLHNQRSCLYLLPKSLHVTLGLLLW